MECALNSAGGDLATPPINGPHRAQHPTIVGSSAATGSDVNECWSRLGVVALPEARKYILGASLDERIYGPMATGTLHHTFSGLADEGREC